MAEKDSPSSKPDYNAVWHDLKRKLIAASIILGSIVTIVTYAKPIGDVVLGSAVRYYTQDMREHRDSTEKSYALVILNIEITKKLAQREFAKTMEVMCTILKGELKKHRVPGTDKFVYETNEVFFEGYYYDGEFYFFQEIELNGFRFIHPWSAKYNTTEFEWGFVDDQGNYNEIK